MDGKHVIKLFIVVVFSCLFFSVEAQNDKETVHLFFDSTCKNMKKRNGKMFYFGQENFKTDYKKNSTILDIDTLPVSCLENINLLTIDELKAKETAILKEIATEIKKEYGIPFPSTTMYHTMFHIYIIEKFNDESVIRYKVTWQWLSCNETDW